MWMITLMCDSLTLWLCNVCDSTIHSWCFEPSQPQRIISGLEIHCPSTVFLTGVWIVHGLNYAVACSFCWNIFVQVVLFLSVQISSSLLLPLSPESEDSKLRAIATETKAVCFGCFFGVVPKGLLTFLGSLYEEVAKTTPRTLAYCFERQTARKVFLPLKNTVSST